MTAWRGTAQLSISGSFRPFRCIAGHVPEWTGFQAVGLIILFSSIVFAAFAPLLLVIAISSSWIRRGRSSVPSERIGKKGRVFKCSKFRTMVEDADKAAPR